MSLPRTGYLWAALLTLALLVPRWLPRPVRLSQARYFEYLTESTKARIGLAQKVLLGGSASGEATLRSSYRAYEALAPEIPGAARRAILLGQVAKIPWQPRLLKGLDPQEARLWSVLYDPQQKAAPLPEGARERLLSLRLGFLEKKALADFYARTGDSAQAESARQAFESDSSSFLGRLLALLGGGFLAFLIGLALLALLLIAVLTRRWTLVGRVATRPESLPAGLLLDAFLFYLALYRVVGLAANLALGSARSISPIVVAASVQWGSGLVAAAYLCWRLRAHEGMRAWWSQKERLAGDIAFGLAGWCAALPVYLLLAFVSRKLFEGSDAAPNPIFPMLSGASGSASHVVVFLMVAVAAPLFEELFFRGALFSHLRVRMRPALAIVLSSVVFALMHPPLDWIPIIGLGLAFGAMRELRQSLVPGIVAHCLHNALMFLMFSTLVGAG